MAMEPEIEGLDKDFGLMQATEHLYSIGLLGLVLLDREMNVVARHGCLVDWIPLGVPARDALPFLVGYESELDDLAQNHSRVLQLTNVSFVAQTNQGERVYSVHLYGRETSRQGITLLLQEATHFARLEQRVVQQRNELALKEDALATAMRETQAAREEADAANAAKSQFLANVSHELRTPLNVILGYTQILRRDQALTGDVDRAVDSIHQSGRHLLALIDDVLDLSKIEAGRMTLSPVYCDPNRVLTDLADMFAVKASRKGVDFDYRLRTPIPKVIMVDETRLRQILINILSNAVKFTEQGSITLEVASDGRALDLVVADTGIGIPAGEQAAIFEPFRQLGNGVQRSQGTGLGLAITRRILSVMEGRIAVHSEAGKGSRFCVRIPIEMPEGGPSRGQGGEQRNVGYRRLEGEGVFRVLVVDDSEESRRVVALLLADLGFAVEEAANGIEAIGLVSAERPDLVLMDMSMPGIDGLEATERLLKLPGCADLPVIALSARAFRQDLEESRAAGCRAHLVKPLDEWELLNAIPAQLPLEWEYEEVQRTQADEENGADGASAGEARRLTSEQLESIWVLVTRGDVLALRRLLDTMDSTHPLVARLQKFAEGFRMADIRSLVGKLRKEEGG